MVKKKDFKSQNMVHITPPASETHFEFFVAHQLELSISLISIILIGNYFLSTPYSQYFQYFTHIQGENDAGLYEKTYRDIPFVFFYFLVFTFLRTFLFEYVFVPFIRWYGLKSKAKQTKFKEQAFQAFFYTLSFCSGMYLLLQNENWMDFKRLWDGYPHLALDKTFKTYYLVQISYWLQQMYFVQIEVRRKDYLNMISHHVITNALVIFSYLTNYNRVGHVMLVLMDFADIFLSSAKVFNYLRFRLLCDLTFSFFFIAWIASRHIGFGMVIYSIMYHPETLDPIEKWEPENGIFYTFRVRKFFLALLLGLQILMIVWFYMILKVLYKVVFGSGAEDVRSSDEEEDLEVHPEIPNEKKES